MRIYSARRRQRIFKLEMLWHFRHSPFICFSTSWLAVLTFTEQWHGISKSQSHIMSLRLCPTDMNISTGRGELRNSISSLFHTFSHLCKQINNLLAHFVGVNWCGRWYGNSLKSITWWAGFQHLAAPSQHLVITSRTRLTLPARFRFIRWNSLSGSLILSCCHDVFSTLAFHSYRRESWREREGYWNINTSLPMITKTRDWWRCAWAFGQSCSTQNTCESLLRSINRLWCWRKWSSYSVNKSICGWTKSILWKLFNEEIIGFLFQQKRFQLSTISLKNSMAMWIENIKSCSSSLKSDLQRFT